MSAFVPDCEHDIFISYAHVDNQPDPGKNEGWVSTLIKVVRNRLSQKLGRSDAYSLWMDPQLSRHCSITPEIINALQKSATMLVILSPGYLESEWCLREKNAFLSKVQDRVRSGSRTFIVEIDKLERAQRPSEFGDLLGYRFWVADGEGATPRTFGIPDLDQSYYNKVNELCNDLAKELQQLKKTAANQPSTVSPIQDAKPTVFLAEVTDDLESQRDDVKAYFDQAGLRVLPETWYPRELASFQQAMDKDISQCKRFVQLLSELPGKRVPGSSHTYVRLQYERAKMAGVPISQWRSPELKMDSVKDSAHQSFLNEETVMAVGMEEFKREVSQRIFQKPLEPRQKPENTLVFVNAEAADSPLAKSVRDVFHREGMGSVLPLWNGNPEDVRKELEKNLLDCDALLILYGNSPVTWVHDQLRYWRKVSWKREQPIRVLAVCEGPPEPKDELTMVLPTMQHINCRSGLNEAEMRRFLQIAKGETSP